MGFTRAEETYKNSAFGPGTGPIWMDGLDCFGGEASLMNCHYKAPLGQSRCDHTEDLGVKCINDSQPFVVRHKNLHLYLFKFHVYFMFVHHIYAFAFCMLKMGGVDN